jgi:hypothetical protein
VSRDFQLVEGTYSEVRALLVRAAIEADSAWDLGCRSLTTWLQLGFTLWECALCAVAGTSRRAHRELEAPRNGVRMVVLYVMVALVLVTWALVEVRR